MASMNWAERTQKPYVQTTSLLMNLRFLYFLFIFSVLDSTVIAQAVKKIKTACYILDSFLGP